MHALLSGQVKQFCSTIRSKVFLQDDIQLMMQSKSGGVHMAIIAYYSCTEHEGIAPARPCRDRPNLSSCTSRSLASSIACCVFDISGSETLRHFQSRLHTARKDMVCRIVTLRKRKLPASRCGCKHFQKRICIKLGATANQSNVRGFESGLHSIPLPDSGVSCCRCLASASAARSSCRLWSLRSCTGK